MTMFKPLLTIAGIDAADIVTLVIWTSEDVSMGITCPQKLLLKGIDEVLEQAPFGLNIPKNMRVELGKQLFARTLDIGLGSTPISADKLEQAVAHREHDRTVRAYQEAKGQLEFATRDMIMATDKLATANARVARWDEHKPE
jgi:hypothetical protein